VEAVGVAPAVMEIEDEPSGEGKVVEEMGTGASPVCRMEVGDSFFKDYPGDAFEKVGEINPEETPQAPSGPVLTVLSAETPSSTKLRRKRI